MNFNDKYLLFHCFNYVADIYEEVSSSLKALGLETECIGGGRINHNPDTKNIKVYGYSQVSGVEILHLIGTHPSISNIFYPDK